MVAVWSSGNGVGRINEVILRRARLVLTWVTVRGFTVLLCSHSRQLSLLPSVECEMSTGQEAMALAVLLCWEGNPRNGVAQGPSVTDCVVYRFH